MRHGREPRQPRTAKQLDLFGIPGSRSAGLAPGWEALPPHARAELTTLMIRLIWDTPTATAQWRSRPRAMSTEKIRPHHLERKAILYVRQSSAPQVLHNREGGTLQYAMRDRLAALGWSTIETVDDDLGRSAAGGVARAGFERMVAELCLGKWVRSPLVKSRASPGTAAIGSS